MCLFVAADVRKFGQPGFCELFDISSASTLVTFYLRSRKGGSMKTIPGKSRQTGQGMTEYIVVVALVAVAAIAVYQTFGQVVRSQTAAMAKELAGEDGTAESQMAQTAAQAAAAQTAAKTLKSFTGNAGAGQ